MKRFLQDLKTSKHILAFPIPTFTFQPTKYLSKKFIHLQATILQIQKFKFQTFQKIFLSF